MNSLRYQPVIYSDGTVNILETIIDDEGQIKTASYEPVRLEGNSIGEIQEIMREVYKDLRKTPPITEHELDAIMYGVASVADIEDEEDNVINLITYMANPDLLKDSQ